VYVALEGLKPSVLEKMENDRIPTRISRSIQEKEGEYIENNSRAQIQWWALHFFALTFTERQNSKLNAMLSLP